MMTSSPCDIATLIILDPPHTVKSCTSSTDLWIIYSSYWGWTPHTVKRLPAATDSLPFSKTLYLNFLRFFAIISPKILLSPFWQDGHHAGVICHDMTPHSLKSVQPYLSSDATQKTVPKKKKPRRKRIETGCKTEGPRPKCCKTLVLQHNYMQQRINIWW